jgi:hypothetical protein
VSATGTAVFIWVKNTGTSNIDGIERSDIFYGSEGTFSHIAFEGLETPHWSYELEGGYAQWEPGVTCKITIALTSSPPSGTYIVKTVIPNGIFDNATFSVN